ncbi:MAG: GntR family transcriptional regulator, partial [Hungatella sp.]
MPEQVADRILKFIIDSDMESGAKLPNEFDLGESIGVGRSTIREAIKILVSRNIVEIKRGDGTYVSEERGVGADPLG